MIMQAIITQPLERMKDKTTKPEEYLNFARRDAVEGDKRGYINAITNVKRAIDSQLDVILEMYGLLRVSIKEKWAFPKKIEVIQKIGLVSPNILNVISSKRVQVEHYHKDPAKEDITEFLGITEMFLELFKSRCDRIVVLIDYDEDFAFWMDLERGEIRVYDSTKLLLKMGGIETFQEIVHEKNITPLETIPISDIDSWTAACGKYIRR